MSMQAESLEVLRSRRRARQARAIVRNRDRAWERQGALATKQDVNLLGQELRQEMAELRASPRRDHASASSIRQMYGALLAIGDAARIAYFFATHVR
jgi:hypothetical protein